ncbi:MFS transporter [Pyrenophora tritici-repentis]|nr:MFS transporter [Pyrenophora tritici-repentis]KAI1526705.1 MFS transporter [Pyrenophora tritici-repentis]
MGGFFALAGTSTLNDVFFVHERGLRVGLWNFAIIVSVNLTPVFSGYVISNMSWKWSFWLEAILFGLALAAVILLFPETTYHRDNGHSIIEGQTPTLPTSNPIVGPEQVLDLNDDKSAKLPASPRSEVIQSGSRPSWRYFLGLGSVHFENTNRLFAVCIKPTTLLLHPIVLWGCVMWSVTFTWTILLGAVVSQIFGAPPYNMSTVAVGNLTGIAPFIGSALGTVLGINHVNRLIVAESACDKVVQTLAARNNGVYEPEFRLLVISVATVALALGSFGLGGAIHVGLSANACGVFMAVINFGVGLGCTGIVTYTNDVCGERAGDAFGLAMVTKSAFAFGLTFILNDYYAQSGPLVFFATFGAIAVGVMLTTLPMYVFGKKIRIWGDSLGLLGSKMT